MGTCFSSNQEDRGSERQSNGQSSNSNAAQRISPLRQSLQPERNVKIIAQSGDQENVNKNNVILIDNPRLVYFKYLMITNDAEKVYGSEIFHGSLSNRRVALKSIRKHQKQEMDNEIKLLSALSHSNIANLLFTIESPSMDYFLVTDYCGHLLSSESINDVQSVFRQLTDVVEYLQSNQIVHLEICPNNIFVDDNSTKVKLFNFHRAKTIYCDNKYKYIPRFEGFTAPEILILKQFYLSSDVYSLGCLFFYIMTNRMQMTAVKNKAQTNQVPLKIYSSIPDNSTMNVLCKDLIAKMLMLEPMKRISPEEALKHPFFWSALEMITFILKIANILEKDRNFRSLLSKGSPRIIDQDWTKKVEEEILNSLRDQRQAYYKNRTGANEGLDDFNGSIVTLVKTIRNTYVHPQCEEIVKAMGDNDEDFINYWNEKFPKLILHLYRTKIDYDNNAGQVQRNNKVKSTNKNKVKTNNDKENKPPEVAAKNKRKRSRRRKNK